MNEENRKLLDEVTKQKLEEALNAKSGSDEEKEAFRKAMEAVEKQTEISKVEASKDEVNSKQELAKSEAKRNMIIKGVEIGVALVAVPVVQYFCNKGYAKLICTFEKDYTFTTSAGRSLNKLFNFKK